MKSILSLIFFSFLSFTALSQEPTPPLTLENPYAPSNEFQGNDLRAVDPAELRRYALILAGDGQYAEAAQLQYYAVQGGGDGMYNLACFLSRAQLTKAAIYWLLKAAREEGVDADWSSEDPDLAAVRYDKNWPAIADYLVAMNGYWGASDLMKTSLVVPEGYANEALPAVVGLHGLGGSENFVNDAYQNYANKNQVIFIGISGTRPQGPKSFSWAEDVELDHQHVQQALASLASKINILPGKVMLFGFSQGGQMSFELAASYPSEYAGALVMSPGTNTVRDLSTLPVSKDSANLNFILTVGGKEHPGNIRKTRMDHQWSEKNNIPSEIIIYEDMDTHSFPPDFAEKLDAWISTILKL